MRRPAPTGLAVGLLLALCLPSPLRAETAEGCIARVLAQDARLASRRDHGSETAPMAAAVRQYVSAMRLADMQDCPEPFRRAFVRHLDAWDNALDFLRQFDAQRGEMHSLFNVLRDGEQGFDLRRHERAIFATWAEVEAASGLAP